MRYALLVPVVYFIVSLVTIGHYGVSIDEPAHFRRGQAFLHFFLTGKKDYSNIPIDARRSFYQDDNENGRFYIDAIKNQSHPPINDTLAALGNYIFYQKLGFFDDVDSHHLFGIFSVTLLLFGVYLFARTNFGIFSGFVSAISVALYPMFLGESHFNLKDPPQASFFAMTLFLFWFGLVKRKAWLIIFSSFFCALALGTKFNVVFIPFIVIPWLFISGKKILRQPRSVYIAFLIYPFIVLSIFFLSNPNIWVNSQQRITEMVRFYLSVGTRAGGSPDYQPQYLFFGFNTYPFFAILYTVPLIALVLSGIGLLYSIRHIRDGIGKPYALILLWLAVPILRVTLPGTTIYGGIRHIFEFVPAMGILSGIGAKAIGDYFKPFKFVIIFLFIPIVLKLISIHPNENVYFNPLIGGLKGAWEKNFPSAGASLGNTYLQGVWWVNTYGEYGTCIATPIGLRGNVPESKLRSDLRYDNTCQSNLERKGEYAMEMVYNGYYNDWYAYKYYEAYLYPVHEVKVDGVSIFKVFKNDIEHTKKRLVSVANIVPQKIAVDGNIITFELDKQVTLAGASFRYSIPQQCAPIREGSILISKDGEVWQRETDSISVSHGKVNFDPDGKTIERKFAAVPGKYIRFVTDIDSGCTVSLQSVNIFFHPDSSL